MMHSRYCSEGEGVPCDCGLDAAIAEARRQAFAEVAAAAERRAAAILDAAGREVPVEAAAPLEALAAWARWRA